MESMTDRLARRFAQKDDAGPTEEELKAERIKYHRQYVTTGPRAVRHVTAGQVRRAEERERKAQHRKSNRRYRAAWKRRERQRAVLRGLLQTVGALPAQYGEVGPSQAARESAEALLLERYDSIEAALQAYQSR